MDFCEPLEITRWNVHTPNVTGGKSRYRNHRYITRKYTKDLSSNSWDQDHLSMYTTFLISRNVPQWTHINYFYNYENSNAFFPSTTHPGLKCSSRFLPFWVNALWGRLWPPSQEGVQGPRTPSGSRELTCKAWGTSCAIARRPAQEPSPGPHRALPLLLSSLHTDVRAGP